MVYSALIVRLFDGMLALGPLEFSQVIILRLGEHGTASSRSFIHLGKTDGIRYTSRVSTFLCTKESIYNANDRMSHAMHQGKWLEERLAVSKIRNQKTSLSTLFDP